MRQKKKKTQIIESRKAWNRATNWFIVEREEAREEKIKEKQVKERKKGKTARQVDVSS